MDDLGFQSVLSDEIVIVNVNECAENLSQCDENADCTDTDGFYECSCHVGFIGNGFICMEEVDECDLGTHDCDENAVCADAPVGFTCACKPGFNGDGSQGSCIDIDECEK